MIAAASGRSWWQRSWWRSAAIRFAIVYAALFGVSAAAIGYVLWWSTAGLMDRETQRDIEADAAAFTSTFFLEGVQGLAAMFEQREASNMNDDAIYMLADPQLRYIAGDIDTWPASFTPDMQSATLKLKRAGLVERATVNRYVLPGGLHLLVGRDVQVRVEMAGLLARAMGSAGTVALMLSVAGGFAVRSLFASMLGHISATATAISAGDLARRVPLSGRQDELDELAATINDMLDRMGRLMDGVRQVSNAIAHDLRTPIARARARLEDAGRSGRGEAELRAGIERAVADLDAVVDVFQSLLRIAEIEAGSRRSAFAAFDLAPVLRDLAELYEAAAEERGQALAVALPDRLPVLGDRGMLQQAVANLLDNALKFSPAGGVVRLSASIEAGRVTLVVADQGPGMSEADRLRAPERFFRAEAARTTPGSGLGLALVQAVAALHGGALTLADNAPGLRASLLLGGPAQVGSA